MEIPRIFWADNVYSERTTKAFMSKAEALGICVVPSLTFGDDPGLTHDSFTNRCIYDRNIVEWVLPQYLPASFVTRTETMGEFRKRSDLPIVAKASAHRGQGKYLLETSGQLMRLFHYLDLYKEALQESSISFSFQEYIQTPSKRYTSYRVLVDATGHILAASMRYSPHIKGLSSVVDKASIFSALEDPESDLFLGSPNICSNRDSEENNIVLNPSIDSKPITDEEKEIVAAHRINPANPLLPQELADISSYLGVNIGRRIGLFVGIDFIQNIHGGFKFLEMNIGPGLRSYINKHHYNFQNMNHFTAQAEILEIVLKNIKDKMTAPNPLTSISYSL